MNRTLIHFHLALLAAILILAACATLRAADSGNLPLLTAGCLLWGWTAYHRRSDWAGSNLFLLTWLVFPLLKGINHYLLPWHADALLTTIDRHLWGGRILPDYFRYETHPHLTDLLAACYFSFYAIVLGSVAWYAYTRATPAARRYFNGLIFLYGAGFIGYLLLPAAGPAFTTHPDGGASTALPAWTSSPACTPPSLSTSPPTCGATANAWRRSSALRSPPAPSLLPSICATIMAWMSSPDFSSPPSPCVPSAQIHIPVHKPASAKEAP